jgi:SpoVK/Ycf46/Vps4 family AAA+-type ATPase
VALREKHRAELQSLLSEWHYRDKLIARQIHRRKKILLHGPPGCGKSMTAQALGNELGLPTFVVRIDSVVGAYLGQTALRVRELFRFVESTPCILLLDEIDALGKRRGSPLDVGELDRVVIALMQELEHADPQGFVVATSNLPQHLDRALFRRFDQVVAFPRPLATELRRFAMDRAKAGKLVSTKKVRSLISRAGSYAEVERRIAATERAIILDRLKS